MIPAGLLVLGVSTAVAVSLGLVHHFAARAVTRHYTDDRCPVIVLSAHRAARQPGSNVAQVRGGRR